MTRQRPIDAVPWGPDDPKEDELGLAQLTIETNMAGMAFPLAYPWFSGAMFWVPPMPSSGSGCTSPSSPGPMTAKERRGC